MVCRRRPEEAIPEGGVRAQDGRVQLIGATPSRSPLATTTAMARAFVIGAILIVGAALLAWLVLGTGFIAAIAPAGRTSTHPLLVAGLAWTFALAAPAAFGLGGIARIGAAVAQLAARRVVASPAVRALRDLSDDHAVATWVQLPDGSRIIPEIVVGPFGIAVVEELPPVGAVVSRGARAWEVRAADGRVHVIDQPLERASRDAERVRVWFGGDDADHVIRVYAAVVGTDPTVERSAGCASITPAQVRPWLASLPVQRSFDAARRERVIRMVRSTQ